MFKTAIIGTATAQQLGHTFTEGDEEFLRFTAEYGKSYASRDEFEGRRKIFQEKL